VLLSALVVCLPSLARCSHTPTHTHIPVSLLMATARQIDQVFAPRGTSTDKLIQDEVDAIEQDAMPLANVPKV